MSKFDIRKIVKRDEHFWSKFVKRDEHFWGKFVKRDEHKRNCVKSENKKTPCFNLLRRGVLVLIVAEKEF